jgi:putative ATPase
MECLPENLRGRRYYRPTNEGFEKRLKEKLRAIEEWKKKRGQT